LIVEIHFHQIWRTKSVSTDPKVYQERARERERPLGGKISNVDRKRFDYEVLKMQDKKMTEQVEEGDDILYLITNGS